MFDLRFHRELNRMLQFRAPKRTFAKSHHEAYLLKQERWHQNQRPDDPLFADSAEMQALEALRTYVLTSYSVYFDLDAHFARAHALQWDNTSVYLD